METGFILNTKEGYYKSGNTRTKNIERAKVYKELSFLCKYAVFPYFVKDNRVVEGVQLIRIGKDDNGDIVAACDLGELWSCLQMYNMGYEAAKYHYTCGNNWQGKVFKTAKEGKILVREPAQPTLRAIYSICNKKK